MRLALSLAVVLLAAVPAVAETRPNVILFLADDLGWGDLGCYGHPAIQTPHLDAFAKQGVRLPQCYSASAVCSPSRSALLTGRTPHRNGVFTWISPGSECHLRKEEVTLPSLLNAAGYATCHSGKWHLNGQFNRPTQPQPNDHGYDWWMATQNNAGPSHKNPTNFVRNGKAVGPLDGFSAPLVVDEAVAWLKDHRNAEKPFFLAVWTHEPHLPIESDPQYQKPYEKIEDADVRQHHGNVTQLDAAFGKLMKALDDQKLAENTFVFFTSDNGPEGDGVTKRTRGSTGGLRGRKRSMYEGGIRVPGIARWPGKIPAGTTCDVPVIGSDMFPTMLGVAGVKVPADRKLDGVDVLPVLTGKAKEVARPVPLYWRLRMAPAPFRVAMRVGDWKILATEDLAKFELYNIAADPKETTDLQEKEKDRFEAMKKQLKALHEEIEKEGPDWWKRLTADGARPMPPPEQPPASAQPARPNVVWIVVDDMSANFSCYGEKLIQTPHVDRLAKEGTRFSRAFVTAPVCSPSRSALVTGMYQTSIGAHHHRSGRGTEKIHLPEGVVPVPALFKAAGYWTSLGGPRVQGNALAKSDYNFEWQRADLYDGNDWAGRKAGQPFFAQVMLHGGKNREGAAWATTAKNALGTLTSPDDVTLPPYYPRDPLLLRDWAAYLDAVRFTDKQVGDVIKRLEDEKLLDSTVVVFLTDHGISHARGKQFLYDEGTHVPLVLRGPGVAADRVRDDLVEHIDVAATSLALAGIPVPKAMQGRDVLAKGYQPRDAVFAARDRCDETVEHLRSVRTERFKYVRNYLPERPHLQPNRYKDNKPIVQKLRELHEAGKLDPLAERLLFAPKREAEELYDLAADPFETRNLAADPAHKATLEEMRRRLAAWEKETNDLGRQPEAEKMYDADMAVYLQGQTGRAAEVLKANIELMKKWAKEGK